MNLTSDKATPEHVLKYLARYMTGGPISDRRLVSHENGKVIFRARSGKTPGGNPTDTETVSLSGSEFVRRWSMHILPKGYVKTRRFGGYSNHHRQRYITECHDLLLAEGVEQVEPQTEPPESAEPPTAERSYELNCPDCGAAMLCIAATDRRSWSVIMNSLARPTWYDDG